MPPDSLKITLKLLNTKIDSIGNRSVKNPFFDATENIPMILGIIIFTIIILSVAKLKFIKHKHIEYKPQTTFNYICSTFINHYLEYIAFFGLPLFLGTVLKIDILNLWAIWGFLLTTLSAFYAARADYSSNKAMVEAKRTYNTVVQFADSLEMFIDKVIYELLEYVKHEDKISIKFLTVIPVFGTVGLEEIYTERKKYEATFKEFHQHLCQLVQEQLAKRRPWNIEILTHQEKQTKEWLTNIYSTTIKNTSELNKKVDNKYKEQKEFVKYYAKELTPSCRRMRFWEPSLLPNIENLEDKNPKIPFQFLLIKKFVSFEKEDSINRNIDDFNERLSQGLLKMFFLFSGDFLYDFVFKILQGKLNMTKLQQLTKGYYTDDQELLKIFNNIFWNFSKNMPELNENNYSTFFP